MKSIRFITPRIESTYHKLERPLYLIGIVIGLILLIYQAIRGVRALQNHHFSGGVLLWPLLLSLSILMFNNFQQVVAWFLVMKGLGLQQTFSKLFGGYMVSFLPRYIPGVFWGYLSRNTWLSDSYRIKPKISTLGSFFEIIVGFIGIFLVFGLSLSFQTGGINSIFVCIALLLFVGLSWWFFNRSRIWINFLRVYFKADDNKSFSIPLKYWSCSVGILALNMVLNGLVLILIGRDLALTSVNLELSNVLAFASYFCLAYLIGFFIFFLPAGLGLREVSLSYFLVHSFGMLPDNASALSVIFRLMMVLAEISWLMIILVQNLVKSGVLHRVGSTDHRQG